MQMIGIGTDIVHIPRIEALYRRFGNKFVCRILSFPEQEIFKQSKQPIAFLAKRFAAKEAVAKAFGTGIGAAFAFNEINVTNSPTGKPQVTFLHKAKNFVKQLGEIQVMISLADEKEYALAYVIILKNFPL